MNKRNINIVSSYASNYGGNFIPSLLELASSLNNNSIVIFSFPKEAKDRYWLKHIVSLGYKVFYFAENKKQTMIHDIKKINKDNYVNITYFHFISPLLAKIMYPLLKKMKIIIHIHSDFSGGRNKTLFEKLKAFLAFRFLRRDIRFIFVSHSLMNEQKCANALYLPNAYCKKRIPVDNKIELSLLKKRYEICDNDKVFLFFGWSPFIKGLDVVVKAFLSLKDNSNKKLIIIHKRDNGKKICDDYLIPLIGSDYLKDKNILFIEPQEDIISLYQLCFAFISSSRSEGFSYSILEALVNDKIVFMSDIIGTRWASKYNYVYSYPVEDFCELSKLMENDCLIDRKILSLRREAVLNDFNIDNWVETIVDIIDSYE